MRLALAILVGGITTSGTTVQRNGSAVSVSELYDDLNPNSGCEPTKIDNPRWDATRKVFSFDDGCGVHEVPQARLFSRLDRAEAWSAELAGRLDDAQRLLDDALRLDPAFERAGFDLARVALRRQRPADAARAVRPFVEKAPVAAYARLALEPTLTPILDAPPLANLRAPRQGTAHVDGPRAHFVAYSAARELFAAVQEAPSGDGDFCRETGDRRDLRLTVVDKKGSIVATLPFTVPDGTACFSEAALDAHASEIGQRLDGANRFLRDLGFDPVEAELAPFTENQRGSQVAHFDHARRGVAERDGTARLLAGDRTLDEHALYDCASYKKWCEYPPTMQWAAWLPALHTILISWHTSGAEHTDRGTLLSVWEIKPGDR
jgi:hypothetical protein